MKKEHRKKLDKMYEYYNNYDKIFDILSQEEYDDVFISNMKALAATKDMEILEHLLDFFDRNFDYEVNEVCECLKMKIGANFSLDQLIEAFYKKFDHFAKKYLEMCAEMSIWCVRNRQINDGHWDRFREMFNTVKSPRSSEVLEELKSWIDSSWLEEEKNMVYALEEDMKKW
jgi:hypothetical protein